MCNGCFFWGASITTAFVLVRATNLYGDPAPWSFQTNAIATMLSYINCEKYPPSLLYLAMTLGPALMLLAAFDGVNGKLAGWITAFGRVPFFYYIVHTDPIHALALLFSWVTIRQYRVDVRIVSPGRSLPIMVSSPRHIRRLAGRGDFGLSGLSLVRRHQAPSR